MNARYVTEAEAYEELANAIVEDAVQKYKIAYMKFLENPHDVKNRANVDELRVFFGSEWYSALTTLDADYLLNSIEKECKEKHAIKNQLMRKRKENRNDNS